MEKQKITCNDLDAIGVFFIKGGASEEKNVSRVKMCRESEDEAETNVLPLYYVNFDEVVYFEAIDDQTKLYYGNDAKSQQMILDFTIDEIQKKIVSSYQQEETPFVRFGNYYIVNHYKLNRITSEAVCFHDAQKTPIELPVPEAPSREENEEFKQLVPGRATYPLCELEKIEPALGAFMKKYKRFKSYSASLRRFKLLMYEYYGK